MTESAEISPELTAKIRGKVDSDAAVRRSLNAVTSVGLNAAAMDHQKVVATPTSMSTKLDKWKVTNQKRSGRCWLFASLNLLRKDTMTKLNIEEFEFSQNYALFWEKYERSNYFLETMIALSGKALDSRPVQFLLGDVLNDGGQWDMLASVYMKYGVVPKEAMPETEASSNTQLLNGPLKVLLRRSALELREMVAAGKSMDEVRAHKEQILTEVYQILVINLGVPPVEFDWQWRDKDNEFHRDGTMTPKSFFDKYVDVDLSQYVCLVDDPRREHPKNAMMTVQYLGNVVGGQPVRYLNLDVKVMKEIAAALIEDGHPVWFGCDVGQQSERKTGLLVNGIYDYSDTLGVDLKTTKEQRVLMGESLMTHAMLLTGVDTEDGNTRRWRVENSWGDEVGEKGFFTMDDDWFSEYVFEVVVPKSALPEELAQILNQEPLALPAWDPMGALA